VLGLLLLALLEELPVGVTNSLACDLNDCTNASVLRVVFPKILIPLLFLMQMT